jgi:hypothetical protein
MWLSWIGLSLDRYLTKPPHHPLIQPSVKRSDADRNEVSSGFFRRNQKTIARRTMSLFYEARIAVTRNCELLMHMSFRVAAHPGQG